MALYLWYVRKQNLLRATTDVTFLADKSRHGGVSWHLHESLFWPFLSLVGAVLYRIFRLCTVLLLETSGRRYCLPAAIFLLRANAAWLWLLACIHYQFHLVCGLALCGELGAFALARGARCRWSLDTGACLISRLTNNLRLCFASFWPRDRRYDRVPRRPRLSLHRDPPSSWKTGLILYLCCVDASALHVGSVLGQHLVLNIAGVAQGVQLIAHGFHEGRPVFSTGTIPPAQSETDLCEVVPLGRSCNLLLPPSSRPRRQVAVFLGRPSTEPPLLPCPITMLADERLHGPALHRRILLNLGADGLPYSSILLQSPLPGLPAEQLLFLPSDLGWNDIILPVDLRPLGGSICLVREQRSATCGQLLATALESQGRFRALQGVLGRCSLGWFSLGSQPLILPGVDALQFAYGPEPNQVQPLFGASLEPPFTLDTLMQVSAVQAGPPLELFSGFSANHAVLLTPNGLVYIEVPVFTDSNTYRRLVSLQASPTAAGGIMRLWQPLPSLPHVQFLEVHCTGEQVPCVLDFRPTGWRIVTTCVEPPVTPTRALEAAVDDGLDIPSEWPTTCRAGGFGILHKETAVSATQTLVGGAPYTLLFFPHIFTHDDDGSSHAVGGRDTWDKAARTEHTLPPPLPGQVGSYSGDVVSPAAETLSADVHEFRASSSYDVVADSYFDSGPIRAHAEPDSSLAWRATFWRLPFCVLYGMVASIRYRLLICLIPLASAMTTQSEPSSPRHVIEAPKPALDAARLAPPSARQRLQTHWQHSALDVEGPLWPAPSSGSQQLRFSFKLWGPEESHVLEFLGVQPAREVRTEILRYAGVSGRPRVFAASLGLSTTQVHLVMASTVSTAVTILLDAGFEVWCADVPRHTSAAHLLSVACDLAATDALQLNTEITLPLRHGDVMPIWLDADKVKVDLSRHVLARAATSAATWLDPVQSFYLLTFSRGLLGFQIAAGLDIRPSLLRSLLPIEEGSGGTFLELPSRGNLPHRIYVHCRRTYDHVVFRVSEASDPADTGFFFLFSGAFDTYADFARALGQLHTAEARWLRALRPYGLSIHTWESMELTRSEGSSFWYVQLHADIVRAQLHFAHVHVEPASFIHVERQAHPGRPLPLNTRATQTVAGPGGFPHELTAWQVPQQPTHCEPGLFPEVSSVLADVWCDAWHVKCLIPCIPGYQAWALRDGGRLVGLCTVDITWDLVSQALHISSWELPQTFVHGDGLLIPYPGPLQGASDKCLSVSHDTPEAVACLHRLGNQKSVRSEASRRSGWFLPLLLPLYPGNWRTLLCLYAVLAFLGALGVRLDEVLTDAEIDPAPEPLPFRDYMDLTRTCTMSWTHELSRQTLGFSVRAQILGEHLQRIAPAPEILVHVWRPGRGPTLLQVRPRRLALHLSGFLQALGYSEGVDSLHVAFDTNPRALDLVLVPPTGGTWWILQDSTGMEVLRPVTRHYSSAVHFRLLTVSPDRVAQTVCPAYSVVRQPLLPQGARGRVIRDLPELHGSLCQGILSFATAASFRRRPLFLLWMLSIATSE